jgi:pimeloyl-ACP methyl ester carboxylesterase
MSTVLNEGHGVVRATDGAQIHYSSVGAGPITLLFMHGWGGSGSGGLWKRVLERLDMDHLRLVAVDLRGHGRSDQIIDGFTTERFAEDMFDVADHLGATDLVLIAFSMSGRWAQWMSSTRPDRVAGQILIAPAPAEALPLTEDLLDDWIRATRTRTGFDGFIRQFTKNELAPEILNDYFAALASTPEHSLRESFRMCSRPGFTERLSDTQARTLVVAGRHDPLLTPAYLRDEVVSKIPSARIALLDCGHEIPLEMPVETAAIIESFVAALGR